MSLWHQDGPTAPTLKLSDDIGAEEPSTARDRYTTTGPKWRHPYSPLKHTPGASHALPTEEIGRPTTGPTLNLTTPRQVHVGTMTWLTLPALRPIRASWAARAVASTPMASPISHGTDRQLQAMQSDANPTPCVAVSLRLSCREANDSLLTDHQDSGKLPIPSDKRAGTTSASHPDSPATIPLLVVPRTPADPGSRLRRDSAELARLRRLQSLPDRVGLYRWHEFERRETDRALAAWGVGQRIQLLGRVTDEELERVTRYSWQDVAR